VTVTSTALQTDISDIKSLPELRLQNVISRLFADDNAVTSHCVLLITRQTRNTRVHKILRIPPTRLADTRPLQVCHYAKVSEKRPEPDVAEEPGGNSKKESLRHINK
jgi:hypothetical protein